MPFAAQPPCAALFERLVDAQSWQGCAESLASMLVHFRARSVESDAPERMPQVPHLPFVLLQFDRLLCDTIRDAPGSIVERLAHLKWLLLPYESRKHMRAPFQGLADDSFAIFCWTCILQVRAINPPTCVRT